jgi:hypothetical protein
VEIYPEFNSDRHESLGPLAYLSICDLLSEEESRLESIELMGRAYHTIDTRDHDRLYREYIDQSLSDIGELVQESCVVEEEFFYLGVCPASHETSDTIDDIVCRREIRESDTMSNTESMRWFFTLEE